MELVQAAEFFREHDRYQLVTHRRPDGDTLGSAGALCHALRRMGKTAFIHPNPEITETYLPFMEPYLASAPEEDCINVAVDVADPGIACLGFEGPIHFWLDHHLSRNGEREPGLVRHHKAACGELMLELILELLASVDKTEADLLYMAVSTDTGCFCYANTNADTFRSAAALLEAGADLPRLNKLLFRTKRRSRLLLEGMIYSSLRSYRNSEINIALVTLDMLSRSGVTEDDCDDLANLAGQVAGNRVAITVRELTADPPRCKVSLRTDGGVDASRVCARFGGGGHKMAAGCELPLSPAETAEVLRAAVEEVWA